MRIRLTSRGWACQGSPVPKQTRTVALARVEIPLRSRPTAPCPRASQTVRAPTLVNGTHRLSEVPGAVKRKRTRALACLTSSGPAVSISRLLSVRRLCRPRCRLTSQRPSVMPSLPRARARPRHSRKAAASFGLRWQRPSVVFLCFRRTTLQSYRSLTPRRVVGGSCKRPGSSAWCTRLHVRTAPRAQRSPQKPTVQMRQAALAPGCQVLAPHRSSRVCRRRLSAKLCSPHSYTVPPCAAQRPLPAARRGPPSVLRPEPARCRRPARTGLTGQT